MKRLIAITLLVYVLCSMFTYAQAGPVYKLADDEQAILTPITKTSVYNIKGKRIATIEPGDKVKAIGFCYDAGGEELLKVEYAGIIFKDTGFVQLRYLVPSID